jgi:hypothetical protein
MFLITLSLAMQAATSTPPATDVAVKQERKICRTLDSDTGFAHGGAAGLQDQGTVELGRRRQPRHSITIAAPAPTGSIRLSDSASCCSHPWTGQLMRRRARALAAPSPAGATSGNARVVYISVAHLQRAQVGGPY